METTCSPPILGSRALGVSWSNQGHPDFWLLPDACPHSQRGKWGCLPSFGHFSWKDSPPPLERCSGRKEQQQHQGQHWGRFGVHRARATQRPGLCTGAGTGVHPPSLDPGRTRGRADLQECKAHRRDSRCPNPNSLAPMNCPSSAPLPGTSQGAAAPSTGRAGGAWRRGAGARGTGCKGQGCRPQRPGVQGLRSRGAGAQGAVEQGRRGTS